MKPLTYCFDLDSTLCYTVGIDYELSKPNLKRIAKVNELFDAGSIIYIFTARGFVSGLDLEELTERQLHSWGLKFHRLFMGKPAADFYVDDKAVLDVDFFSDLESL
jgi:CMP-N,N'-diacetyllegionaminic acid synthase